MSPQASVRDVIETTLRACLAMADRPIPETFGDAALLLDLMDSLSFAILVVQLEEALGYDPFSSASDAFYPQTYGQFVAYYEANRPAS